MTNPLAPVFEWWIAFTLSLPGSFMNYLSFYWAVSLAVGVIFLLFRSKH